MTTSTISNTSASGTGATSSAASDAIYTRVENLMQTQSAGVAKLNGSITSDTTKLSGLGQLQSALAGFQSVAAALAGAGLSTAAKSSTAGVLQASTDGSAVSGTYAVDVQQLAQGQVLSSPAQASAGTAIGGGAATTITIDFGTTAGGVFKAGETSTSKTLTIDSSNNTLAGIAAALKSAGIDASVVQGKDGYSLTLNGADGGANSMRISASGDAAVSGLLAYDPAGGKGLTQTSAAQDAVLTVDGKQITSATNTIGAAITGTSLTLTGTGKTNVTVAHDTSQIANNVSNFVTAYNALAAQMTTLQGGALKSDSALSQVSSALKQILQTGGGSPAALAKAGVTLDGSGKLTLDSAKLNSAIAADPDGVSKLFTNDGKGLADKLDDQIATLTGSSGRIAKEVASATSDLSKLTTQKAALQTALTAQAQALVALYTQQDSATNMFDMMGGGGGGGSGGGGGGTSSLFDMLA